MSQPGLQPPPSVTSGPTDPSAAARKRKGRALRIVRRVHMYAGLVLMPWLLFFGLSGVLFNHPNVGEEVHGQRVTAADLKALSDLQPWSADGAAQSLVQAINDSGQPGGPYRLDPDFRSQFSGYSVLNAPAPDGGYMLILDVSQARGVLVHKKGRKSADGSSFPRLSLPLEGFSSASIEQHTQGLLTARKLPHDKELHAHPKIAPELRLRVLDAAGVAWNLSYATGDGELSGRRADRFPNLGVAQILGSMHKTHHFTLDFGPLWFWALFEDLLGIAMVLWAITGIVMWWQMKRTRIAGAVSLAIALGIAALVMSGTLQRLHFGDVKAAMGPGD